MSYEKQYATSAWIERFAGYIPAWQAWKRRNLASLNRAALDFIEANECPLFNGFLVEQFAARAQHCGQPKISISPRNRITATETKR